LRTAADTIEEWGKHDVMSDARVRADYATQLMRIRAMENRHEDANVASELALAAFRELKDTSEAKYRLIGERLISLRRTGRLKDALIELKNAVAEMGERYPEVRALLLGGLAVVSTRVGHKEDALAYVEQAIQLFPKNASIVSQISFSLLLGSAYEYLQMHVETKRIYDEVISNTKEMGMRHSYIELLMWRAANANEWGEYNLSFKDLEEVGASARQMKSVVLAEWSSLCVVDNLLDLGVIPEAVERWHAFKKEFPKPNDSGQEARRLNIDAALAEHQGDYQTALSYRKRGVVIYDKLGDLVTVGRIQFRILRYEVLMGARSVEEAVGEFNRMVTATDQIHVSHWQYARHEAAYFLAAQGGHPEPGPDLAYDPLSECLCAYYRQYLAVAKIQWLDAAMNYNAADELRTRYREMREKMKEKIPAKYHVAFVNHPSYRVPERGRC
jgi:tetratricopeptide (TPR) repeat protein